MAVAAAGAAGALATPIAAQFVFERPLAAETGLFALRTFVGDLDEDGQLDLVTTSLSGLFPFSESRTTLCFGLGGGQFTEPQELAAWNAFGLADFDADGHLDLLSSTFDGIFGSGPDTLAVAVSFGDRNGGFGPPLGISDGGGGQNPDDAAVGDFDGDGALDVAIHKGVEPFLNGRITVVFGHGDGTFDAPVIVVPFAGIDSNHQGRIRAGDTNGDGFDDIVYTTGHGSPTLVSQGNGSFVLLACPSGCGVTDRDFVLVDVNADGRDDAVTNARVLLAAPDGSFTPGQVFPPTFVPLAVAAGDLDADGRPDVVLGRNGMPEEEFEIGVTTGDVLVLRGHGDGSFQLPGTVASHVPQPRAVALADIDVDGRDDLVVAGFQQFEGTRTLFNRSYGPNSPFTDLGGALAGTNGYPIQFAAGTLVAGQPFSFRLAGGPWNGMGYHVVGIDRIDAPFKGGTMIPSTNLVNGPFQLDFLGGMELAGNWPAGASGLTLYMQFWMPQGGGPAGFVATSGVQAQVP